MKLYYHRFDGGVENFGDTLNAWLWPRLLPSGILDDDPHAAFVGMGTLLNSALPSDTAPARRRVVFSSGVGYGEPFLPGPHDKIYCVRGPLSARALNLAPELGITDGAALVRRLVPGGAVKICKVAFMPHIEHIADRAWPRVCADLGIGFVDPRWPTERVLGAISRTQLLVAEAMHGAIVADALRVPWVAAVTRPGILPFKWQDWCASLEMEYAPVRLPCLFNPRVAGGPLSPARAARYARRREEAHRSMARLLRTARPVLSDDCVLERAVVRLEERLAHFTRDVQSGLFAREAAA